MYNVRDEYMNIIYGTKFEKTYFPVKNISFQNKKKLYEW